MRAGLIRTYLTVGSMLGVVLAVPAWRAAIAGRAMPKNWAELQPLLLPLALATGHGVLRMYSRLPSLVYYVGFHGISFETRLFNGW